MLSKFLSFWNFWKSVDHIWLVFSGHWAIFLSGNNIPGAVLFSFFFLFCSYLSMLYTRQKKKQSKFISHIAVWERHEWIFMYILLKGLATWNWYFFVMDSGLNCLLWNAAPVIFFVGFHSCRMSMRVTYPTPPHGTIVSLPVEHSDNC